MAKSISPAIELASSKSNKQSQRLTALSRDRSSERRRIKGTARRLNLTINHLKSALLEPHTSIWTVMFFFPAQKSQSPGEKSSFLRSLSSLQLRRYASTWHSMCFFLSFRLRVWETDWYQYPKGANNNSIKWMLPVLSDVIMDEYISLWRVCDQKGADGKFPWDKYSNNALGKTSG